jgi:hypothetical protein
MWCAAAMRRGESSGSASCCSTKAKMRCSSARSRSPVAGNAHAGQLAEFVLAQRDHRLRHAHPDVAHNGEGLLERPRRVGDRQIAGTQDGLPAILLRAQPAADEHPDQAHVRIRAADEARRPARPKRRPRAGDRLGEPDRPDLGGAQLGRRRRADLTVEVERQEDVADDLAPVVDARRQREPVGPEHDTHAHPRYAGLIFGSKRFGGLLPVGASRVGWSVSAW